MGSFCTVFLIMLVCPRVLFFGPFDFPLCINNLVRKISGKLGMYNLIGRSSVMLWLKIDGDAWVVFLYQI